MFTSGFADRNFRNLINKGFVSILYAEIYDRITVNSTAVQAGVDTI